MSIDCPYLLRVCRLLVFLVSSLLLCNGPFLCGGEGEGGGGRGGREGGGKGEGDEKEQGVRERGKRGT